MATKNTNAPIVNDTLIDWVIKEEGFLDKPTNIGDGKITLGSGLTAQKWRDKYRKNGNKWTKQDNRAAVREELESRKRWAEDTIPNWENLPDDTKRAMLSYKYNYDFDAKNSPKLFSAMKSGDYIEAVRQMDATSKDPKFKKGLQERRNREQAWGLGALIGSNAPIYQEVPPIVEYPDNTRVFNPYTPLFEDALARPALVPTNPTTNYVEARQAEPEEWQQDDALAAFRMLERARNYRDSMLWENQPELPQRDYNPTEAPYLVTRYDKGGNLEKKKTWDELSVKEKADMMRVAVENGITSLSEIKDKYNEFAEGGNTEDDVVLPEQEGFIYKGPTYEEVKQQIDPLVYNEISKQAAVKSNPTKEIVGYKDYDGNLHTAINTAAGILESVYPEFDVLTVGRGVVSNLGNKVAKKVATKIKYNTPRVAQYDTDWSPDKWFSFNNRAGNLYDAEDVASLTSHIPEYRTIEETAKANGNWLKMSDGSMWKGDPRSWVQLQSKAVQKYNPDIFWTGVDREVSPTYNGKLWGIFGKGKTPAAQARMYATNDSRTLPMFTTKDINTSSFNAAGTSWKDISKKTIGLDNYNGRVTTDMLVDAAQDGGSDIVKIYNVTDPGPSFVLKDSEYYLPYISNNFNLPQNDIILKNGVFRKSLLGNNGDFSHPTNIYKGLAPLILGYSLSK